MLYSPNDAPGAACREHCTLQFAWGIVEGMKEDWRDTLTLDHTASQAGKPVKEVFRVRRTDQPEHQGLVSTTTRWLECLDRADVECVLSGRHLSNSASWAFTINPDGALKVVPDSRGRDCHGNAVKIACRPMLPTVEE